MLEPRFHPRNLERRIQALMVRHHASRLIGIELRELDYCLDLRDAYTRIADLEERLNATSADSSSWEDKCSQRDIRIAELEAKYKDTLGMYRLALCRETEYERNITDEEFAAFDAALALGNNPRLALKKFLVRRKEAAYASGAVALSAQHAEGCA